MQHLFLVSLRLFLLTLIAVAIGCTPAYEMQQTSYQPDQPRWGEPEPRGEQLQASSYQASARPAQPGYPAPTDGIPQQAATQRTTSDYFALIPENQPSPVKPAGSGYTQPASPQTSPAQPATSGETSIAVDRAVLMEMRNTIDALLAMQATSGQSLAILSQPTPAQAQPRQQPPSLPATQRYGSQDPNQLMQEQLQQRVQQAPAQPTGFLEEENFFEAPAPTRDMVPVFLASGQTVQLDEALLKEWEAAIQASKRGEPSFVELPAWLMKGLEMLTHAPTEEPARSQTIMPLYRELEGAGYLRNVNLNQMTSRQVVAVMRFLVDDVKRNQGRLNRR